jgi:hypothetical protein
MASPSSKHVRAWQTFKRRSDQRKAIGEDRAVAREEPDPLSVAPRHHAESVMLDLVNPIGPRRRLLSRSGEAWFNGGFATQELDQRGQ